MAALTPAGTSYNTFTIATGYESDNIRVALPTQLVHPAPMVYFFHSAGDGAGEGVTAWPDLMAACLDEGWIYVGCTGGGEQAWGNDDSQASYTAGFNKAHELYDVGDTLIFARSMGGLPAIYAALDDATIAPTVKAVALNAPVLDLRAAFEAPNLDDVVIAAYGLNPDGSDFDALTAGHNPMEDMDPPGDVLYWRFWIGDADTTVPPADHTTPFKALIDADGGAVESEVVVFPGATHASNQPLYDVHDDAVAFFKRALAHGVPVIREAHISSPAGGLLL